MAGRPTTRTPEERRQSNARRQAEYRARRAEHQRLLDRIHRGILETHSHERSLWLEFLAYTQEMGGENLHVGYELSCGRGSSKRLAEIAQMIRDGEEIVSLS